MKYNKCFEEHKKRFIIVCPQCDEVCKKDSLNNYIKCSSCYNSFCHVCRENHDYDDYDDCPNKQSIEDEFTDICNALGAELKKCPLCSIIIEKNEGCNSTRCKYCKVKFCWNCLVLCCDIRRMKDLHECENYDGYIETNSDDEYRSGDEFDDL